MNYYDMSISELKTIRDRKRAEYSVKRIDYMNLCEKGIYIKDKKLIEEFNKEMETIENEALVLEDLIHALNYLIWEKQRK